MSVTARAAALRALGEYRRSGTWPDALLGGSELSPRDMALAKQILRGVLQNMALCDWYAAHFSSIGLKKLEPRVLDILRISIYQLVFLTKIPPSAAVNEGVALARKHSNPRGAGFVNAVLRKAAQAAGHGELPDVTAETEQRRLAIKYSHPEWLVREFCELLGENGAEELLQANNAPDTPVTAQVNTLRANIADVLASLERGGVDASAHEWLEGCVEMRGAGSVERLETFKNGHIYIQDAAARISVMASGVKPGDFVIDACAAPGGKSFAAAIAMQNTGRIESCDIQAAKLRRIEDGAARLSLGIITAHHRDAAVRVSEYESAADVVIADVPCSGFGVIRKKPEIRYKQARDIETLPDIQKRILSNVSSYVKPGGTMLYSTCTVLKRENEDVIEWFLQNHSGFSPEDFTIPGAGHVFGGMVTLWPHVHGTDGFFICKLRRRI